MRKDKDFVLELGGALCVLLLLALFCCSSCKVFRESKQSSKDSTVIHKESEGSFKSDSSGSKTENTKETVYYPQPIYIEGKDGETKVVFVPQTVKESGKTEQAQIIKDTSWKDAFNSLAVLIANKETEKKVKVATSPLLWVLIGVVALLLIKNFLPFKISRI